MVGELDPQKDSALGIVELRRSPEVFFERFHQRDELGTQAAPQFLSVPCETNQVFMKLGEQRIAALSREFGFYPWGPTGSGECRFVVSWDTPEEDVDALCDALTRL